MATERITLIISEKGAKVVSRKLENVGKSGRKAGSGVDALRSALLLIGGALLVRKIIGLADSFVLLQNQIKVVSGETDNLADTTKRLFDISNRTRTSIAGNVQLFQRLSFASKDLGASQAELFKFVEQTGKLLAIQGGSAAAAKGALIQLTQAMGSGIVRGEEFNSILEGAFSVAKAAAKGIDAAGGSVSKLRTLVIKGKITSEQFFRAILSQSEATEEAFGKTTATIGQSFNILENAATKFFGELGKSTGVVTRIATAIQLAAANMDILAIAVGGLAVVLGGALAAVAIPAVIAGLTAIAATVIPLLVAGATFAFGFIAAAALKSGKSIKETFADIKTSIKGVFSGLVGQFTGGKDAIDDIDARLFDFSLTVSDAGGEFELTNKQIDKMLKTLQTLRSEINTKFLISKFINPTSSAVKAFGIQLKRVDDLIAKFEGRKSTPFGGVDPEGPDAIAPIPVLTKGQASSFKSLRDALDPVGAAMRATALDEAKLEAAFKAGKIPLDEYTFLIENLGKRSLVDMRDAMEEVNPTLERQRTLLEEIKAPAKEYAERILDINVLLADGAIKQDKFNRLKLDADIKLLQSQNTAAAGAKLAFLEMRKDAQDFAGATKDLITNAFQAGEDAIIKFAQTGKFEISDFVRQVSADLLRLGTRELFSGLTGGSGGGGGVGGLFTSLFSGGGGGIGSFLSSLNPFQHGGQFTVGGSNTQAAIPGVDNRLVAFRARDGETVSVTPRGESGSGGRPLSVVFNFPPGTDVDSFRRSQGQVAARTASALRRASDRNN